MDTVEDVLRSYACAATPIFNENFSADCCLNGTRVTLEVLRSLGLKARPLSVAATASNDVRSRRPYSVEIDHVYHKGKPDNGWYGHLVALVEDGWIVDLSARQFRREEYGINPPEILVTKVKSTFKRHKMHTHNGNGWTILYRGRSDTSYLDMSGYQPHEHNMKIVALVQAALQKESNDRESIHGVSLHHV